MPCHTQMFVRGMNEETQPHPAAAPRTVRKCTAAIKSTRHSEQWTDMGTGSYRWVMAEVGAVEDANGTDRVDGWTRQVDPWDPQDLQTAKRCLPLPPTTHKQSTTGRKKPLPPLPQATIGSRLAPSPACQ